jgi:hypothetical protein
MTLIRRMSKLCLLAWCVASAAVCVERILLACYMSATWSQAKGLLLCNFTSGYWSTALVSTVLISLATIYILRTKHESHAPIWSKLLRTETNLSRSVTLNPIKQLGIGILLMLLCIGAFSAFEVIFWDGGKSIALLGGCLGQFDTSERIFNLTRTPEDTGTHFTLCEGSAFKLAESPATSKWQMQVVSENYGTTSQEFAGLCLTIGSWHRIHGDLSIAKDLLSKSESIYRQSHNSEKLAETLLQLSACYQESDSQQSERCFQEALSAIRSCSKNRPGIACLSLASALANRKGDQKTTTELFHRYEAVKSDLASTRNPSFGYQLCSRLKDIALILILLSIGISLRPWTSSRLPLRQQTVH